MVKKVSLNFQSAAVKSNALLEAYPNLSIIYQNSMEIIIEGTIRVSRIYNDFPVCKDYLIRVTIPSDTDVYPYVTDIGNHIGDWYWHIYQNRVLCLATEIDLCLRFSKGFDIIAWMHDFVEPYYYSYEYYQRFLEFPFGERLHGVEGIIQSYCDYFVADLKETINMLAGLEMMDTYRGHHTCPCGSGKRIRDCHGEKIYPLYANHTLRKQVLDDIAKLKEELQQKHEKHPKTAK